MTRFLLFGLCAVAVCLPGCASLTDILKGMEPIVDAGVQFAANSAGEAVKEQMGNQAGAGEIAALVTTSIVGLMGAVKASAYAWNRKPKDAPTP